MAAQRKYPEELRERGEAGRQGPRRAGAGGSGEVALVDLSEGQAGQLASGGGVGSD